jgi:hypothetical protein
MRDQEELFSALAKSTFRQKFHLKDKDREYLCNKGLNIILTHADDFISKRLAPAFPANDGKQTPFRGHPVFVAQHVTACCCRSCLAKWHQIPKGKPLSDNETAYICAVLEHWLRKEFSTD